MASILHRQKLLTKLLLHVIVKVLFQRLIRRLQSASGQGGDPAVMTSHSHLYDKSPARARNKVQDNNNNNNNYGKDERREKKRKEKLFP